MKIKVAIFLICMILACVDGKKVTKTLTFTESAHTHYVSKFGISVGRGTCTIKARFKHPYIPVIGQPMPTNNFTLVFNVYQDTKWEHAQEQPQCVKEGKYSARNITINISADGSWSEEANRGLSQRSRPFVWFVAAADCEQNFHARHPNMPPVEVSVHFKGIEGGEFSHEEMGLLTIHSIMLVLFIGVLAFNAYNYYKEIEKTDRVESPILILMLAVFFEFLALLLQWFHLLLYSYNGEGSSVLNILSIITEVTSQFLISLLLILLSWGWTITYLEFGNIEIYLPLIVLLFLVHVIIAGLTQISNDASHKYHDFEGIQGILLVLSRIGMFTYYCLGMKSTYNASRPKAREFIKTFSIYGSIYMLSFPLLVVLCFICAPYNRHKIMAIGTIISQSIAAITLLRLFIGKTSYTAVAKQHNVTILPTGKND